MKYLILIATFFTTFAMAQNKKVTSSTINWWGYKVAKTAASSHTGTIDLKSGYFVVKGKSVTGGSFVFDMNSLTSTDLSGGTLEKFNGHLKNGDFFETEKFPLASYVITSISKSNNAAFPFMINGNLTVKGITKKVSFPAKLTLGKVLTLESDKFSFNRQDFNVEYQSAMKDVVIKNDIDMKINLTAN
ncbi:YceI family protein [Frigoriflavimonas asaccharolytica]|uniref:Polyisoprenoid-binding protein YceI n=1 Tax=Frigoriflavimonas asaccharolytica TaxID=2735899 RepID=A0A8J8K8D3_9FLAO|nr:YceI family protein [Frigoriflavimonas asaccharolytica]NRS92883.1 polyisoprenoid-binding protein YceI [Frigoriflavimonas asaccharolytica]